MLGYESGEFGDIISLLDAFIGALISMEEAVSRFFTMLLTLILRMLGPCGASDAFTLVFGLEDLAEPDSVANFNSSSFA